MEKEKKSDGHVGLSRSGLKVSKRYLSALGFQRGRAFTRSC